VDWLDAYEIETNERSWQLGAKATLTVILRELTTDNRSHVFLPVDPVPAGETQREAIIRAVTQRFPDAREKTYNNEKQVASFVGRRHLYIVIYEEHELEAPTEVEQARLFAA
jgi:hypothetical protein